MTARTYRLRKGQGRHICNDGTQVTQDNPIITTEAKLAERYPLRFEDVTGMDVASDHPWGIAVLSSFPLAEQIPGCIVWKKNRRYRIAINGKAMDTVKLTSEDEVNSILKTELKRLRNEEVMDEEDNEEIDEDDDDDVVDEVDEDDDDDEEELVKAPVKDKKPKGKAKGKGKK